MNGTRILIPDDVPFRDATRIDIDALKLDKENPRLWAANGKMADEDIVTQLYKREDLRELLLSIAANGYLDIEPLIVVLDKNDRKFIVLEGNRRLAAIRLFLEPELAKNIEKSHKLHIELPTISKKNKETLSAVSVYRVENRDATRSFIGFKHINGAAKWESYAKARYAADWHSSGKVPIMDIAVKIGDRHDTVKRMIAAIYVLDQAKHMEIFSLSNRNVSRFSFSHLYTALARSQYMEFLGIKSSWSKFDPKPNPVPKNKLNCLREVLVWLYGSKEDGKDPIILSQNPDIKNLGETLANAEGLHILRAGGSLTDAHASTKSPEDAFISSLIRARNMLREVINSMRGYDGCDQSLIGISDDVVELSKTINRRMKDKKLEAKGDTNDY